MGRESGLALTGGTARGTKLFSVAGRDVRPALARMRISVFEILRSRVVGARVVDLFAGTGSLGFEALSRGASDCVFLDVDDRCIATLRRNAGKLKFTDRVEVVRGSAFEAARVLAGRASFDLLFVDPPYDYYDDNGGSAKLERAVAGLESLLSTDALVIAEHRTPTKLGESWGGGRRVDERAYGGTTVSFYQVVRHG